MRGISFKEYKANLQKQLEAERRYLELVPGEVTRQECLAKIAELEKELEVC